MTSRNVPRLRFNEFINDWNIGRLGDLSKKVLEKNTNLDNDNILTDSAHYGVINQREFFDKDISRLDASQNYTVVKKNQYIYNPRISQEAKFGPIKRNKLGYEGIVSPLYYVFTISNDLNYNFFDNFFDSDKWHHFVYRRGNTGARSDRVAIKDRDLEDMYIKYPNLPEQQHIGNFFSKLDHLIDLHSQKLEQLKKLKHGYLQKMFPQKGEIIPRLRFIGFSGNWEEKRIKDIVGYRRGSFPQPYGEKKWYDENGYKFAQVVDVKNNMANDTKLHISSLAAEKSVLAKKGTILVTIQGSIGRVAITKYETYVDRTILLIDKYFADIDSKFLSILLIIIFENKKRLAPGSTIKTITKKELSNFKIKIPELEEQRRIGQFFEHLDDLIESNDKKISELKRQKKAYLQKMFI